MNALIERDRDADNNSGTGTNGLEERLYATQDGNWNTTALINTSGTAVERNQFDPYGTVTFLTGSWGSRSSSSYASQYLDQGGRLDSVTGEVNFQHRDAAVSLGIWDERDIARASVNSYEFVNDNPTGEIDWSGLAGASTTQPNEPREQPLNFRRGNEAHRIISEAYEAGNGGPGSSYLDDASLSTIANEQGGDPNRLFPGTASMRPDIDHKDSGSLYEIKSVNTGSLAALATALVEMFSLRRAKVCRTHLGSSGATGVFGFAITTYGPLIWASPMPGVILYSYPTDPNGKVAPSVPNSPSVPAVPAIPGNGAPDGLSATDILRGGLIPAGASAAGGGTGIAGTIGRAAEILGNAASHILIIPRVIIDSVLDPNSITAGPQDPA